MNQLIAIRCFARVVETASFTCAADSLGMPKATVSKLVQDLEAHLGVLLLQRSTRKVSATADGEAYYEGTARLVRELEDFDASFTVANVKPKGRIRVDAGGVPARMILIPALAGFYERFPDMRIDLGVGNDAVDLIGDNVDCVIRGGPVTTLSLVSRPLGQASWTTCATPGYLARHGRPAHPDDLRNGHLLVGYRSANSGRAIAARFQRGSEVVEVDGPCLLSVDDGGARVAAGLAGLGLLQTFTFAVRDELRGGRLIPVLQDWAPPRYPFHVIYPRKRTLTRRVRVFIDWLAERFAGIE
jgi:LysR family transcriptional regulator for bpeEF and oprC